MSFAYESGPCGYGVYREITETGHDCQVVAPSLIPRKLGDRVMTDRRDAVSLARLHRAGELTAVWVPGRDQEAVRDLTRAREDMKALELKARQRLGAFLLRHGRVYGGKSRWTQAHFRWLEQQRFDLALQQTVFQEYVDAVVAAVKRTAGLEAQMHETLRAWSQRPTAEALMSLRGVSTITAMTILAELGDLTRFDSPRQLVSFLGLAPGEHSSGSRRRRPLVTRHFPRPALGRAWLPEHPARSPLRRPELLTYTHHTTSSALGAQKFPSAASSRISLSSVKSATARFRRPFSRSRSFRLRAWLTFIPPYSRLHR